MKKAMIAAALFGLTATATAQERTGLITTNPLGMLFSVYNAEYQMPLTETGALSISGYYFNWAAADITISGLGLGYVHYFDKMFEGMFVYPSFQVGFASYETVTGTGFDAKIEDESTTAMDLSAILGYRWTWETFSTALGAGYGIGFVEIDGESTSGVDLLWDIGFAF